MNIAVKSALCALLLSFSAAATGHELFVTVTPARGTATERVVVVNNGTFHKSAAAVRRDRVRDLSLRQGGRTTRPDLARWTEAGDQSRLTIAPAPTGTFVVGLSSKRAMSTRTAKEFAEYLAIEDLPDTLAAYDAAKFPNGVTYGYMKHARAIGQAGATLTDDYAATLGYPLEVRLERNPGMVRMGERLSFQVLHEGMPVANLRVYVGAAAHGAGKDGHGGAALLRTDAQGRASFEVASAGTWYIHANRMVPSTEAGFDFLSDRASLTFEIPSGRRAR